MENVIKSIPHNIEAEIALLGSILLDEQVIVEANDELTFNDFFDLKNKTIYKAMINLYENKITIDATSLIGELKKMDAFDQIGGVNYINSIITFNYTTSNVSTYISLIVDNALKRYAIDELKKLSDSGYLQELSATDYLTTVEQKVYELSKRRKTENFTRINDVAKKVRENIELNAQKTNSITGLDTGYHALNSITLGFQKENLIILAARPAMGKSAIALNLAVNIAANNKGGKGTVAIFSLEMGSEQLVERLLAADASINLGTIKTGGLQGNEWRRLSTSTARLGELNLYFDDSSLITVADIRAKCRKLSAEVGLDFVVIDYLQLIEGDGGNKSKQEEVSKISRSLKLMARELQIPVLALAQLSREVEKREDKKPIMADLRDSGSIEQDADIVMFLYREDYYLKEKSNRPDEADLIIAKNRSGASGKALPFIFQGGYSRFIEKDIITDADYKD